MPGQHRVEVAEASVAGHVDLAGQGFLGGTAVVDDLSLDLVLREYFFGSDRTYAQEVVPSAVAPVAVGIDAATRQRVVFAEHAHCGLARAPRSREKRWEFS